MSATPLPALEAAIRRRHPRGTIRLMVYPGHPGGEAESRAIAAWLDSAPLRVERLDGASESARALKLLLLGHA